MLELAKMEEKKRILSCIIGRNQQKEFLNGKRL